jgi:hypothetical protein
MTRVVRTMTAMRSRSVIAATLVVSGAAGLLGCDTKSTSGNASAISQRREQTVTLFHQVWPLLSGATNASGGTGPVATGAYEQCADDGSTMAYGVDGYVPVAKATANDAAIAQVRDLLTKAGWTAQTPEAGTQALRFVNGDQLANVYASDGRYGLELRSGCTPVTATERQSLPDPETLAGTLSTPPPSTASPSTSASPAS